MKPPDQVREELVDQWVARADEDLGLARHLLDEASPFRNAIAYHSQQAAEKYLKAFLIHHQVEFPKTHDLGMLLDLVASVDEPLAESLRDAETLTQHGVEARYPGDFPPLTSNDTRVATERAERLADAIRRAVGR